MKYSVIVCTYNRCDVLKTCIAHLLDIAYKSYEIILVNDGSADGTFKFLSQFDTSKNVNIINRKENCGLAFSRNEGIECASGDYIVICDDDDLLDLNIFSTLDGYLLNDEKAIYVTPSCRRGSFKKISPKFDMCKITSFINNGFTPPVAGQIYPRTLFDRFKYNTQIKSGVDHDLWLQMYGSDYRVKLVNEHISFPDSLVSGLEKITLSQNRMNLIRQSLVVWEEYPNLDLNFIDYLRGQYIKNYKYKIVISERKIGLAYCVFYLKALIHKFSVYRRPTFDRFSS